MTSIGNLIGNPCIIWFLIKCKRSPVCSHSGQSLHYKVTLQRHCGFTIGLLPAASW